MSFAEAMAAAAPADFYEEEIRLPVVDVYEQNCMRRVHKITVPKILSPGFERMGHLTEYIALSWLSKALEMTVTRVYILRRLDKKIGLIRFKHNVARGKEDNIFVWSQTPFHEGAKVVVCCNDERIKPQNIKQLPELSKIDADGTIKTKLSSLRKMGRAVKDSVPFMLAKSREKQSNGVAAPEAGERLSFRQRKQNKSALRKRPEDFGSNSSEVSQASSNSNLSSDGGWVGSECSQMSSPQQLSRLADEHISAAPLDNPSHRQPSEDDVPSSAGSTDPLLSHVRAALEATEEESFLAQLEDRHLEILKHLDPEDLKDPLLLQVALLEVRVALAAGKPTLVPPCVRQNAQVSDSPAPQVSALVKADVADVPKNLLTLCMPVRCEWKRCSNGAAEDDEDVPNVTKVYCDDIP